MSREESGEAILAELRRGPRTTAELMEATGLSRNAVSCAIRRANAAGGLILNMRRPGGHGCGLYQLILDRNEPQLRRCRFPGCPTVLSRSNETPYCRRHLSDIAYLMVLLEVDALITSIMEEAQPSQLELLPRG